jgi:hypothetical protein
MPKCLPINSLKKFIQRLYIRKAGDLIGPTGAYLPLAIKLAIYFSENFRLLPEGLGPRNLLNHFGNFLFCFSCPLTKSCIFVPAFLPSAIPTIHLSPSGVYSLVLALFALLIYPFIPSSSSSSEEKKKGDGWFR